MTYPDEILDRFKPFNLTHLEWGLRRLEKTRPEEARRKLEARLFDGVKIEDLFLVVPGTLRSELLHNLSPERFSDLAPRLVSGWDGFGAASRRKVVEILLEIALERVPGMFGELAERWTPEDGPAPWGPVLAFLDRLPPEDAERIGRMALDRLADRADEMDSKSLATLVHAAARWDEPRLRPLLHAFLAQWQPEEGEENTGTRTIAEIFSVETSIFDLIGNQVFIDIDPPAGVREALFEPGELRDAVFRAWDELREWKAEPALRLARSEADRFPDARLAGMLRTDAVSDEDELEDLVRGLAMLGMAALLTGLYRGEAAFSDLTAERLAEMIGTPAMPLPFEAPLAAELARRDPTEVAASVGRLFASREADYFALHHLARIAGKLGFPELMEPFAEMLDAHPVVAEISEEYEAAARAFGTPFLDRIEERFDTLNDAGKKAVARLLGKLDPRRAETFLLDRFDALWKLDRGVALEIGEAAVSEAVLERIRPRAGKEQSDIDRAFVLLAGLLGRDFPELPKAWDTVFRVESRKRSVLSAMENGEMDKILSEPSLRAFLRCGACGAFNEYELNRVFMLFESREQFFVGQEFTCVDCGRTGAFQPTESAESLIRMQAILLMSSVNGEADEKPEKKLKILEQSPFEISPVRVFGKKYPIPEALDVYEKAIREAPKNAGLRIGFGNVLTQVGRPTRAAAMFREAMAIDPAFVQAHFGLATLAVQRDDPKEAFHWLEAGRRHWEDARMFAEFSGRGAGGDDLASLMEDYCDFYNQTAEKLDLKVPALRPPRNLPESEDGGKRKVGRNDPCPCGSGKKYKKCCLRRVGR